MNDTVYLVLEILGTVASLCGAILCAGLTPLNREIAMIAGIVLVVILRILAAKFKWHLPKA